ncbi:MAG: hypothetical protein J7454_19235, partial [Roseiflexus sp.]|nr:hypothetical protein [Roseiflexus sp.]
HGKIAQKSHIFKDYFALVPVPQAHAIISPKAYSRFSGGMSARSTHKTLSLPGVQAETFAWLQDEALHFYPHMIQKE